MAQRRPRGALEQAVLDHLWAAGRPQTPAEVLAATGGTLAYTTVLTILTRLHAKGLVARERTGRAHAYRPVALADEVAVSRMHEALEHSSDRAAALSAFAAGLTATERAALLAALAHLGPR